MKTLLLLLLLTSCATWQNVPPIGPDAFDLDIPQDVSEQIIDFESEQSIYFDP